MSGWFLAVIGRSPEGGRPCTVHPAVCLWYNFLLRDLNFPRARQDIVWEWSRTVHVVTKFNHAELLSPSLVQTGIIE